MFFGLLVQDKELKILKSEPLAVLLPIHSVDFNDILNWSWIREPPWSSLTICIGSENRDQKICINKITVRSNFLVKLSR